MPRYTPEIKSAILRAAIAARGAGKKWSEAHEAAKEAGYKGRLQGLVKMIRGGNRKAKRGRKPSAVAKPAVPAKRKPGRPKGSKNAKRGPGRPRAAVVNGAGLAGIEAIVERMVEQRVAPEVHDLVERVVAGDRKRFNYDEASLLCIQWRRKRR